ncbi:MAG TPA: phosphatidylinositol-specific phospholipase C domain-containing protein [Rhizomicrobium sp.]|jgi:hypothetical protein|nr:phosphatidylinositol-specific phospholipase C domain-containing protein [Rhizomicrobium sp.]
MTVSLKNWMADPSLKDKRLHELAIPGSHDSVTSGLNWLDDENKVSRTQNWSVTNQLNQGVRVFDIRVNTDDMTINHGKTRTEVKLSTVLENFRDFLLATDETIVMHVKHEWGDTQSFHGKMIGALRHTFPWNADNSKNLFNKHVHLLPFNQNGTIPTLGQLRKKLVYVRRYGPVGGDFMPEAAQDRIDAGTPVDYFASGEDYNAWKKAPAGTKWPERFDTLDLRVWPKSEGNFDYKKIDFRNRDGVSFVVQDYYLQTGRGSVESKIAEKMASVRRYRDSAASADFPESWYLNFVSCTSLLDHPIKYAMGINPTLTAMPPGGAMNFETVAPKGCNALLLEMLQEPGATRQRGTFLLDFCDSPPSLTRTIVDLNF